MRRLSGFSLMEMMIVLLIVAIVAAASAPMVTKKLVEDQEGSDCLWTLTNNDSIFFNGDGNNAQAVIIGDDISVATTGVQNNSRLHLVGSPQIAFKGHANTPPVMSLSVNNKTIALTTEAPQKYYASGAASGQNNVIIGSDAQHSESYDASNITAIGASTIAARNSVALGSGATTKYEAIAIGHGADASKESYAIAIGKNAEASGSHSIAIGGGSDNYKTIANSTDAIAMGFSAQSSGDSSIAIGSYTIAESGIAIGDFAKSTEPTALAIGFHAEALHAGSAVFGQGRTTADNQIVLGNHNTTVYIPGNLVVGNNVLLNSNAKGETVLHPSNDGNGRLWVVRQYGQHSEDNLRLYPTDIDDKSFFDSYIGSDRRLKNVGKAFVGGLEELKKLDLFHYTYKKDPVKTPHVGVMAQDLQKIFPNAVVKGDDGFLRIRMEDMFYAVINAVKELAANFDNHDERILKLEQENKQLQKTVELLEKRLEKLEKIKK